MARPRYLAPSKGRAWTLAVLALVVGVVVVLQRSGQGAQADTVPYLGLVNLGMPTAPQPDMPADFAVTKHFRQTSGSVGNGYGPPADSGNEAMTADHGADCSAPPATHPIGTGYADLVFVCHDHLMTAINSGAYGEVLFQPARLDRLALRALCRAAGGQHRRQRAGEPQAAAGRGAAGSDPQ